MWKKKNAPAPKTPKIQFTYAPHSHHDVRTPRLRRPRKACPSPSGTRTPTRPRLSSGKPPVDLTSTTAPLRPRFQHPAPPRPAPPRPRSASCPAPLLPRVPQRIHPQPQLIALQRHPRLVAVVHLHVLATAAPHTPSPAPHSEEPLARVCPVPARSFTRGNPPRQSSRPVPAAVARAAQTRAAPPAIPACCAPQHPQRV